MIVYGGNHHYIKPSEQPLVGDGKPERPRRRLPRQQRFWSYDEARRAWEMHEAGASDYDICRELMRSKPSVHSMLLRIKRGEAVAGFTPELTPWERMKRKLDSI